MFFLWRLLRCRRGIAAPCHLRRDGTRGVGFCFFFGGCSGVEGGFFHTLGSGQPRMPPRERQHEGFWFLVWGIILRLDWEPLRGHGLTTGVVRHACRHRVTARGVFGFEGGAVVVCSEGGCGSMCWPVDRPATHAAAGAAARGALIFCFGGFFHTLGSGWHERVRGGGFNPLRGATTGVVMRRRATSGEMARGGLVFVFSLEVAPVSKGDSFTR